MICIKETVVKLTSWQALIAGVVNQFSLVIEDLSDWPFRNFGTSNGSTNIVMFRKVARRILKLQSCERVGQVVTHMTAIRLSVKCFPKHNCTIHAQYPY